jgi:transcription termination factor Rho
MPLQDQHLADLHQRARTLGVPRYRMLPRDELIEAIEEREEERGYIPADREEAVDAGLERPHHEPLEEEEPGEEADTEEPAEGDRRERPDGPELEEPDTEPVTGVLDRMQQGYGFLRLSGLHEAEGDVYVSASQIRRCELRPGDQVSGPARQPRRG